MSIPRNIFSQYLYMAVGTRPIDILQLCKITPFVSLSIH